MIDPASLKAAFDSLKFAGQLVKVIISERDANVVKEKALELTGVIIEAQSQTLEAQAQLAQTNEELRELKERIAKMDKWEQEKQRYELVEVASKAALAYRLKESERGGLPDHFVCQKCYQDGQAVILQPETLAIGQVHVLICHNCKSEIIQYGMRQDLPRGRGNR